MPDEQELQNVSFDDVKIVIRNFSGKESKFNPPGRKNFRIVLSENTGALLKNSGWKIEKSNIVGGGSVFLLPVYARYSDQWSPEVVLVRDSRETKLTELTIPVLDKLVIQRADLVVTPYRWNAGEKTGIRAYLNSLRVISSS